MKFTKEKHRGVYCPTFIASLFFKGWLMESQCLFYPLRSIIRCIAKTNLTITPEACESGLVWDEALFSELAATYLQPTVQPLLTSGYQSRNEASAIETEMATLLVKTYQHILKQRENEKVQYLNELL
ncbi:hypothetical protein [Leptothoe sp. PORK10 BA2]|uniref:hypothetical protein n=1 Tax=Leptothoe sp. PORK10 BA2 TaxID=3110254 RepID=UPI002B1F997F|nr:hypothetical protein [Leptothoe sp. PORK10 BA2]MEA5462739.1 hypothetical protein [Leptothoe sp. PORK10 BA2]